MDQDSRFQNDVLTPDELAALLHVSRKFIEEHTQLGQIPGQFKVGRVWRYSKSSVQKALLRGGQFLLLPVPQNENK